MNMPQNILELGGHFEVLDIFNYLKKKKRAFFEIQFLLFKHDK
jgi:hypothetical protein